MDTEVASPERYPNSDFLANRNRETQGLQGDLVSMGLETQRLTGLKRKFLPESLREGHSSRTIKS